MAKVEQMIEEEAAKLDFNPEDKVADEVYEGPKEKIDKKLIQKLIEQEKASISNL